MSKDRELPFQKILRSDPMLPNENYRLFDAK
jgi:hypothetical protein